MIPWWILPALIPFSWGVAWALSAGYASHMALVGTALVVVLLAKGWPLMPPKED